MPRSEKRKRRTAEILDDPREVGEIVREFLGALFSAEDREYEQVGVTIPIPMFRKMIALCHPDKHHNSEMSQEVTRWLIEAREKSKGII